VHLDIRVLYSPTDALNY